MTIRHWDHLKTVSAVARKGSFRGAADELGLSSSTVARHIEQLEEELGLPIFVLREGVWKPTEIGVQLERVSLEIQASLRFVDRVHVGETSFVGEVSVTTVSFIVNYFLSDFVRDWYADNPESKLLVDATDDTLAIELGQSDIALRLGRPQELGVKRFKVTSCPVALIAPAEYCGKDWIGLPSHLDGLPEMRMARAYFGKDPAVRLDSFSALARASRCSGLATILPTCIIPYFRGLRRLNTNSPESSVTRELWAVFHERRGSDPAILAAISWIRKVFPERERCLCGECVF